MHMYVYMHIYIYIYIYNKDAFPLKHNTFVHLCLIEKDEKGQEKIDEIFFFVLSKILLF